VLIELKRRNIQRYGRRLLATAGAEFLKTWNPNSEVAVKDLQTGEATPVLFKPT
jgi:hypothetical protein